MKESGSLWCLFADVANVFFGQMKSKKYIEITYKYYKPIWKYFMANKNLLTAKTFI